MSYCLIKIFIIFRSFLIESGLNIAEACRRLKGTNRKITSIVNIFDDRYNEIQQKKKRSISLACYVFSHAEFFIVFILNLEPAFDC